MTDGSRFARATLAGDLVGLFAFLVLGLDRHGEDVAARFAALASIFAAAWLVTAWFLGTYRPPTYARLLLTLALGIPLARRDPGDVRAGLDRDGDPHVRRCGDPVRRRCSWGPPVS